MAVPKLRFKEFDGNWSAQKYKDVLTIKYGKDHKLLDDGEIPVYGTGGVMRYVNQYLYDGESILIGRKGTIDQPKYVNEKFWTVDTLFYSEIKQDIYPLFIYQHALQVNWLGLNEATGVPSLNTTSINNVDIYLPSKPEQTKIASFLSAVDEKISQLTQKHELLSQYKQGMMQKLFSQQIRFKADDGSEFGEWEENTLNVIAQITMGSSPKSENYNEHSNGLPLLQGNADIKNRRSAPRIHTSEITKKCSIGDILLSVRAPVGFVAISDHEACIGRGICSIQAKSNHFQSFLYQWLLNKESSWGSLSQGSTFESVNSDQIKSLGIHIPCLEEQTKIANFLSSIDQKIEVVAQQIEQAKQWKKGLLQQMFV